MATDDEAGRHLFMSAREVRAWRAKGVLPAVGSDLDAFREGYIRHMREAAAGRLPSSEKLDLDTQKARLAHEQADQVAMKNAVMRREMVPLTVVSQAVVGMIGVAKAKLKRVPGKVAPSDARLKARIADAIEQALIDLSAERAIHVEPDEPDKPADDE